MKELESKAKLRELIVKTAGDVGKMAAALQKTNGEVFRLIQTNSLVEEMMDARRVKGQAEGSHGLQTRKLNDGWFQSEEALE